MIGARLKLARDAAGLSLRALEERLQGVVTAQALSKYERDRMMPSSTVLLALSKALKVSPDYLLSQRDIVLGGIEFRKAPSAGAREEKMIQAQVLERLEHYLAVEEVLHLSTLRWHPPLADTAPIHSKDDAETASAALRRKWILGHDPISSMTELLEEHGIKVIALNLPVSVSGSKLHSRLGTDHDVPAVVINQNHTGERQRFTLAHELGHLVLPIAMRLAAKDQEKAIDRFAGAFLVPTEELRRAVGTSRRDVSLGELLELKARFKVSLQSLVMRLKQAAILSDADMRRHWLLLKGKGFLDPPYPEPGPIPAETSHRLHRLTLRAVSEGALSESKAAELLGISVRMLSKWLDEGAHADAA